MKTYTENELVSFGNYLLSKERADMFRPIKNFLSKKERLKMVHHSDVTNWYDELERCRIERYKNQFDTNGNLMQKRNVEIKLAVSDSIVFAPVYKHLQSFLMSFDVDTRTKEDFLIAIGEDLFEEYKRSLASDGILISNGYETVFGTKAKLVVKSGLNGTHKAIGLLTSNLTI